MIKEINQAADILPFLEGEPEVFAVCDLNVRWVLEELQAAGLDAPHLFFKASEADKTLSAVEMISRFLMEHHASRNALLLAIGGGITTDVTGFAASVYKRGIRWANLPTTLLAQVDAAIGGKTGVNLDAYKNMIGAFHQPSCTFLCADVLKTLSERELKAGLAEMYKTLFLAGSKVPVSVSSESILEAAAIKEAIVAKDPFERGERAKLNLGHTFAHAIEHLASEKGDDISHGEAVAMGILLSARLSEAMNLAESGLLRRLKQDFDYIGLPTGCPYPLEDLQEAMARDKKSLSGGKVKFILPIRPGEVKPVELDPYDLHFATE